jgi:hypothetical protein
MTDAQFNRLMAVQAAQCAMLQSIANAAQAIAMAQASNVIPHQWPEVEALIRNAQATMAKV